MRLRLALAFAALVVGVGPGWASETPPLVAQRAIDALIAGHYVEDNCPKYRANISLIGRVMDAAEVTTNDLKSAYLPYFAAEAKKMQEMNGLTNVQFCDYLFDFYQGQGKDQHIVERR